LETAPWMGKQASCHSTRQRKRADRGLEHINQEHEDGDGVFPPRLALPQCPCCHTAGRALESWSVDSVYAHVDPPPPQGPKIKP
jgi:hypothetical protein